MVIIILVLLVVLLMLSFLISRLLKSDNDEYISSRKVKSEEKARPCPICGWPLVKSERVHSIRFKSQSDTLMHIYGCIYCYKDHPKARYKKGSVRICPSCNKKLGENDYLTARVFEGGEKTHVHVLGCFRCRGRKSQKEVR